MNPVITGPTSPDFTSAPELTWQAVTGASHYEVEVFDKTNDTLLTTFDNITETDFQIPSTVSFSGGTEYRLSVRAHFTSDPSTAWTPIVLENITGGERAPLSVNVSSQQTQTPSIGWFSPSISRVAAEHHNLSITVASTTSSPVYERQLAATGDEVRGTFHTTEQFLPAGSYEVRVQTTYVDGTQSRLNTPVTFTVTDETITQRPTLSPAVYDSRLVRPELQWTTQGNDVSYELWVSPKGDTANPIIHLTGYESESYTPTTDMAPAIYNAWVRATRDGNVKSKWSFATTFAVHPREADPVIVTGGTGQQTDTTPLIQWEDVYNVQDGYELFISEAGNASTAVYHRKGLTGTSHELEAPLEAGRSYNVWVRADYDIRYISAGSSRWGTPYLLTIADSSVGGDLTDPILFTSGTGTSTDTTPALQWEGRSNVNRYDLWINVVGNRGVAAYRQNTLTDPSHVVETALADNTRYEVWIRAYYTDGTKTRWGSPANLDIGTVSAGFPDTPIVLTGGVGDVSDATPTLTWEDRSNVTLYDVYINEVGDRATAVYRRSEVGNNSHTVSETLNENTQYEVWVRAVYTDGTRTRWGSPAALNVGTNVPDFDQFEPVVSYADGNVTWQPVDGAVRYALAIDQHTETVDRGTLIDRIVSVDDLTTTSYPLDKTSGTFQAFVRAIRSDDVSTRNGSFTFTIDFVSNVPVLSINGNTASWQPISQAATYELWVNQYSGTGQLVQARILHRTDLTATSLEMSLTSGDYRGWLRAVASNDQRTAWSAPVAFVIASSERATIEGGVAPFELPEEADSIRTIVENLITDPAPEALQLRRNKAADRDVTIVETTNDEATKVMEELAYQGWLLTNNN